MANRTSEAVSTRTLALVALVRFKGKALSFGHGGHEDEIERKGEAVREERAKMRVFIFIFNIYDVSGTVWYIAN